MFYAFIIIHTSGGNIKDVQPIDTGFKDFF